ncbi:MAG: D-sedoheptulose 7-phosphate isomerase [Nanoarchaeota archaeon]|nr:D-sedoheptulose 7-phosphate isomerase [Nanoarchaeota archaeon]
MQNIKENILGYFKESSDLKVKLQSDDGFIESVVKATEIIQEALHKGNKFLTAGNGGSAADAQHFATEFTGRFKRLRKAYPAIALTTDTSFLTAWSNDSSFDEVFERQIEALGKEGDVFFGISTSGNSKNILRGIEAAKKLNMKTIALLGRDGGATKGKADIEIVVPSNDTPRIQEVHILVIHSICEEIEKTFA